MNSVMSRYIQDPTKNKCKIPVLSALTTGGTGKVGSTLVLYGTRQDRLAFRHASVKPSRSVSTEEGRSATLTPRFRRL